MRRTAAIAGVMRASGYVSGDVEPSGTRVDSQQTIAVGCPHMPPQQAIGIRARVVEIRERAS
jgi:hypothetical protein